MNRRNYLTLKSFAFLVLCLVALAATGFLVGCGTSQVVATLEAVITTAEAAVATLGATGSIPPATVSELDAYLKATADATAFAATELASADSAALKATKIAQRFAAIAAPALPAGTAQTVVAVIQAVTAAVANFLQTIQPAAAISAAKAPPSFAFSKSDQGKLIAIHGRAVMLSQRIPAK